MNLIKLKDKLPTIFAILGCGGVVGTAVLSAVNTPKAIKALDEVKERDGELTVKNSFKPLVKAYWPTALCATATCGCIIAGERISAYQKASLVAALGAGIVAALPKEQQPVPEKTKKQERRKNLELFYEEHYGYFWADPYDIIKAVTSVYQDYSECGFAYLSSFFRACGINDDKVEGFELARIGWNYDYVVDQMSSPSLDLRVVDTDDTLLSPDGDKYRIIEFSSPLIYKADECIWNSDGSGKTAVLEA